MVVFLKNKASNTAQYIKQQIHSFHLYNTFNPSIVEIGGKRFVAFRAGQSSDDRPFRSFLYVSDIFGNNLEGPEDLGASFVELNLPAVSDPKLFTLGEEVWVTINTGHFENPNRIFVMRLHPQRSKPIECKFLGRGGIEKNWGFFLLNDELFCLYMLNPLTLLRCVDRDAEYWEFVTHPDWTPLHSRKVPSLTIGPQPVVTDTSSGPVMRLIAHEKFVVARKRAYLGHALEIDLSGTPRISSVGPRLAHSPLSMLGSRNRHNRNLISCTYFSSMQLTGTQVLLGYGINDMDFNLAETSFEDIGFLTTTSKS